MTPLASLAEHCAQQAKLIRHNLEYMPKDLQESQQLQAQQYEQWATACREADGDDSHAFDLSPAMVQARNDQLIALLRKAAHALENSYNAVEWPANGTSQCEITAAELRAIVGPDCCASYPRCEHQQQRIREGQV